VNAFRIFYISHPVLLQSGERYIYRFLLSDREFHENRKNHENSKPHFTFGHKLILYPYFPHVLTDFVEIQYNSSAHNAVDRCDFHENRHREGCTSIFGIHAITQ
jgi:hypothetical protein